MDCSRYGLRHRRAPCAGLSDAFLHTLDRHSIATLATWLMTLSIHRAEHRDTQAIQANLDELLRSNDAAANELTHIDEKDPEAIERERDARDGGA